MVIGILKFIVILLTIIFVLTLGSISALAQTVSYRIGEEKVLAWDYAGSIAYITTFRVSINDGPFIDTGINTISGLPGSYIWPIPKTLSIGSYYAVVTACDDSGCATPSERTNWTILSPLPITPTNLRIISPPTVLELNQAVELVESYSYVLRLQRLSAVEWGFVTMNYPYPTITYGNVMNFLDSIAVNLVR